MAGMTPKQAVALLAELSQAGSVSLAVSSGKLEKRASRALALDDEAREYFRTAAAGVAAKLAQAHALLAYDATYKPEQDEFQWAPLQEFPQVSLAVSALEPVSQLPSFDPAEESFKKELKYASTVLRRGTDVAYLFRSFTKTAELSEKRKITLMLRGGYFGRPQERLFQFDTDADVVLAGDVLLVLRRDRFRQMFEVLRTVFQQAEKAADAVHAKVPIANLAELKVAVGRDANLADKIIAVTRRSYFSSLDMAAIEQTNQDFGIGVPIIVQNGQRMLQFHGTPQERWKLLQLLDDDHLTSTMTSSRYRVNSKRQA